MANKPADALTKRSQRNFYLYTAPYLLGFLAFMLIPLLYSLYLVVTDTTMIQMGSFVGLKNFERLWSDHLAWAALKNTLYYCALSIPLDIVFALLIALLLNQKLRGIGFFRTCFFVPYVVSGVAVTLLWGWIFNSQFGLLNYVLSRLGIAGPNWLTDEHWSMIAFVIMSMWAVGNNIVILVAAMQDVPTQLLESAAIDGAGGLRKLISIILPSISPAVYFCLVLGVIGAFQIFMPMFLLTDGGPNLSTFTFMLHFYNTTFRQFDMSYGATLAWVLFAVIMLFTGIVNRTSKLWVSYDK